MNKLIAAISTPLGKGGISIVRLSGQGAVDTAAQLFYSPSLDYSTIKPRYLYLGEFSVDENLKESCLMVYFKAPNSYTGEDLVEFQIHGGTVLSQKVLARLIECGAALAMPGEFTRRAFENGKVSLDQAESIIGEISAESESELKASLNLAKGNLAKKIVSLQDGLTESIAKIEATLDYPEEDFEKAAQEEIFAYVSQVQSQLDGLLSQSENSRYITKGINVAIVGSPNVGKSSLLNALIGRDRAIVTDIAGTTRDVLTESVSYKGILLNFVDTAGIRESDDVVEAIGIARSKEAIQNADLVLFVLDGSRKLSNYDSEIFSLLPENHIVLINKSDLPRKLEKQAGELEISALDDNSVQQLKEIIYDKVIGEELDYDKTIVINERQIAHLQEAHKVTEKILSAKGESMDIIAMLIKELWNTLGKITGQCENEEIIDLIFSKFCLGK